MLFDQNMIIDATRGSIARFVNHSCEPNCRMIKWTVAGKPRMALFAGDRGIMSGEELTYDYNFEYANAFSIFNVFSSMLTRLALSLRKMCRNAAAVPRIAEAFSALNQRTHRSQIRRKVH